MDPREMERWLRLMADALRGAGQAQEAVRALAGGPLSPEALARWSSLWLGSPESEGRDAQELKDWVESSWKNLGVVPRYQYLELLERHEELKAKLEQAEATVKNLRELLAERGPNREAQGVLDQWEDVARKTLEAQAEWARAWADGTAKKAPGGAAGDKHKP